ncbi:MAG TPA: DUF4835 family protein [Dinghuibacter sp.]|uniref:type IX secretion system protein PorD n=1 Tax=Dinghuibacter sp. TaxID=2024697 RepID=UPI002BF9B072|nr:DUF4835 family protein [Dinghuibacter sp.]HTJ13812.1 DUF4835 family protein [Dinghuibacter sp.]
MNVKTALLLLALAFFRPALGQELQAKVSVSGARLPTTVDRRVFQALQTGLSDFLNNRKWTGDAYQANEKIECSFLLTLTGSPDVDTYTGTLVVQAARPIYGTSYNSPLINYQDADVQFKYVLFTSLLFDDNRVQGTDPLAANLTALFAYYAYLIVGFDDESFALKSGDPYFQKAWNIVNNAPDGSGVKGWTAFDGTVNRYWLAENLQNSKYSLLHDMYYQYYRQGLDQMTSDESKARSGVLAALTDMDNINQETPGTAIRQFFFQGKSTELGNLFARADGQDKARALDLLQRLDVSNINKYKQLMK